MTIEDAIQQLTTNLKKFVQKSSDRQAILRYLPRQQEVINSIIDFYNDQEALRQRHASLLWYLEHRNVIEGDGVYIRHIADKYCSIKHKTKNVEFIAAQHILEDYRIMYDDEPFSWINYCRYYELIQNINDFNDLCCKVEPSPYIIKLHEADLEKLKKWHAERNLNERKQEHYFMNEERNKHIINLEYTLPDIKAWIESLSKK